MEPGALVHALLLAPDVPDDDQSHGESLSDSHGEEERRKELDAENAEIPKSENVAQTPVVKFRLAEAAWSSAESLKASPKSGELPRGAVDTEQKLSCARLRLRDEDLLKLSWTKESYSYREVDFSQNDLTGKGLQAVVDLCRRCKSLQVLKLFKNSLGDDGVDGLSTVLESCQQLREVHLSHNRLTDAGVHALVEAAHRLRPADVVPLWLRVENNPFEQSSGALLDELVRKFAVCHRKPCCTQFRCEINSKVHLPFLDMDRERRERGLRSARSVSRAARARDVRPRSPQESRNGYHSRHLDDAAKAEKDCANGVKRARKRRRENEFADEALPESREAMDAQLDSYFSKGVPPLPRRSSDSRSRQPPEPHRRRRGSSPEMRRERRASALEENLERRCEGSSREEVRLERHRPERQPPREELRLEPRPSDRGGSRHREHRHRHRHRTSPPPGVFSPPPGVWEPVERRKRRRTHHDGPPHSRSPSRNGHEASHHRPRSRSAGPSKGDLQSRIDNLLGKLS